MEYDPNSSDFTDIDEELKRLMINTKLQAADDDRKRLENFQDTDDADNDKSAVSSAYDELR